MEQKHDCALPPTLGITALVPPELVYACGWRPLDLNNLVPALDRAPARRLCAWTASWRDLLLHGKACVDALAVVAGGDCHNALVDGQMSARNIRTHYIFYPFDGEKSYMQKQLHRLEGFLGGVRYEDAWDAVSMLKSRLRDVEELMFAGDVDAGAAFELLVSGADMASDVDEFKKNISRKLPRPLTDGPRVALLGVPPIQRDFHLAAAESGLRVVFEELPHEFIRLGGDSIEELSESYAGYTFARPLSFRIEYLRKILGRLNLDGAVHYTQYACHHVLEDDALREGLDIPFLTVQGDSPGPTSAGVRLRMEAFAEMLERAP